MNNEYEYSFKVKDITPFIDYCLNNKYELKKEYEQTRTLIKMVEKLWLELLKIFIKIMKLKY